MEEEDEFLGGAVVWLPGVLEPVHRELAKEFAFLLVELAASLAPFVGVGEFAINGAVFLVCGVAEGLELLGGCEWLCGLECLLDGLIGGGAEGASDTLGRSGKADTAE